MRLLRRKNRPHTLATLIVGLIIGWVARGFGERSMEQKNGLAQKAAAAETKINQLLAQVAETEQLRQELTAAEKKITELETKLAETETSAPPSATTTQSNDLTEINGIGPVFAKRLNAVGVHTFAEVANLSPERLRKIVDSRIRVDAEDWIAQAKELAKTS